MAVLPEPERRLREAHEWEVGEGRTHETAGNWTDCGDGEMERGTPAPLRAISHEADGGPGRRSHG